jgi:hypothetical protein
MSRVQPTPVEIKVDGAWIRATVRTCEVSPDGQTCSAVVSFGHANATTTARVEAIEMRKPTGEPGCPAAHQDKSCCA